MNIYYEMGAGLHEAIAAAGYTLEQVDGVWVADNEHRVQQIIDSYVDVYRELLADEIRAHTQAYIYARYPAHAQANLQARALELIAAGATDHADLVPIRAAWDWIHSVRAACNDRIAALDGLAPGDLSTCDWRSGWPA